MIAKDLTNMEAADCICRRTAYLGQSISADLQHGRLDCSQFAEQDALAAVGTSDPVMNLLILGITGLCIGASVIMSNCFGAGKTEELKHEVGMTLLLVMGLSAVILIGLILRRNLKALQTA